MKTLKTHKSIKAQKKEIKKLPDNPGVYIFVKEKTKPIYIGKALNLKSRVSSYYSTSTFGKVNEIVNESKDILFIQTTGEFEALILESDLIKKYKPKYNTSLKDDKSPLYIRITNDIYPKVLTARKSDLNKSDRSNFGPFPSSNNVYDILKTLRIIFPYSTHNIEIRPCLYSQINLCSPCPSFIESVQDKKQKSELIKNYKDNIRYINGILSGRFKSVRNNLVKNMKYYAKYEEYEKANEVKIKIETLDYITKERFQSSEFLKNPNFLSDLREKEIDELEIILNKHIPIKRLSRIECYDVSHTSGKHTTASMVTFINGEPYKDYYRHFKVKNIKKADDISSLSEVLKRRINHFDDWGIPDLIIVDGGKAQVGAFFKILKTQNIYCIGIAKREEKIVIPNISGNIISYSEIKLPKGNAKNLIQRLRDESHRFARRYHHHLLRKELLSS